MSRLEEIKKDIYENGIYLRDGTEMSMNILEDTYIDYEDEINWLINRVDELEEHNKDLIDRIIHMGNENQSLYDSLKVTANENQSLKQALQQILQVDEDTHIADAEKMKEIANSVLMQCSLI